MKRGEAVAVELWNNENRTIPRAKARGFLTRGFRNQKLRTKVLGFEPCAIFDNILASCDNRLLLQELVEQLVQKHHLQREELLSMFEAAKSSISIPTSLFAGNLPPAEVLYKFLKEQQNISFKEIAQRLGKGQKSVWATYQRSKSLKLKIQKQGITIPLDAFRHKLSILENVVYYLHETYQMTNAQIAAYLHKTPNTIAVLYKRAQRKHNEQ